MNESFSFIPVPGAFEPVEDVGAAGVVDLVKRVSVRLLYSHGVAAGREDAITGYSRINSLSQSTKLNDRKLQRF